MMEKSSLILFTMILTVLLASCSAQKATTTTYKNPISLEDEWEGYGIGDPYVFKFNGTYYLYVSTRDREVGVKVWSSSNLVDWRYEGLCTEDPITTSAYAPEVIYWNGDFYMYTSPAGEGHYVLRSDSPTGPFEVITDNIGHTIDGNVFMDDDGQLYFSYAGTSGIQIARMENPWTLGESVTTDAYMNGWTEGSTIFKRNGKYYMTYTGNHVFSDAYRIDYAVSDNPMEGYKPSDMNPIVIQTEGEVVGLGHNSMVKGPDLDTDYMFYHNLEGPGIIGPLRHMNMDRIAWNGNELLVLGPTTSEQAAPDLADFEDRFQRKQLGSDWEKVDDGGKWKILSDGVLSQEALEDNVNKLVTKQETQAYYTAEFHLKLKESGTNSRLGIIFSYQDEENYGVAALNPHEGTLNTRLIVNGEATKWETSPLPQDFDLTKLHQMRVEKDHEQFKIFVDGMLQATLLAKIAGGRIGYFTEDSTAEFGYTAFSNRVNGSGIWNAAKPIPGRIEAVHYMDGKQGYRVQQMERNEIYRVDPVNIEPNQTGSYSVNLSNPGDWLQYKVNVAKTDTYNLDLRLGTSSNQLKVRILQGDKDVTGEIVLPHTGGLQRHSTFTIQNLHLDEGYHEIKLELVEGEASIKSLTFFKADEVETLETDFSVGVGLEWNMYEQLWSVNNESFRASEGEFSKVVVGEVGWTDYQVQADVQLMNPEGEAGIITRVQHAANGEERNQNNPDFNQGYFAYIQKDGLYLAKQNFRREVVEHLPIELELEVWHRLKVKVEGTAVQVYLHDLEKPLIEYEDTSIQPFTHGKVGLLTNKDRARFDNFKVEE